MTTDSNFPFTLPFISIVNEPILIKTSCFFNAYHLSFTILKAFDYCIPFPDAVTALLRTEARPSHRP